MAESRLPRSPIALADHADDFGAALASPAGLAASGLTAAQLTQLSGAITALRTAANVRDAAEVAFRAAVEGLEEAEDAAVGIYRRLRQQANNHTAMTDTLREQARLTVRDDEPTEGALPAVVDLTALGRPSGATFLDWTGPTGGALRYEVYARPASGGAWALVGSATGTDFTHREAGAGIARHYRVLARRGERESEPSNEASVYV